MIPQQHRKKAAAAAIACAIAAPCEGLRQVAYRDPVGIPTICFGATRGVKMGDRATAAECQARLNAEMLQAVDQVERCHPGLPAPVLAAFADASYNIGSKVACDAQQSTAARMLALRRYDDACNQLLRWDKANVAGVMVSLPGLTKRRALERDVCLQWKEAADVASVYERGYWAGWRQHAAVLGGGL